MNFVILVVNVRVEYKNKCVCVCISRVQLKFQRALSSKAPIEVAASARVCVYLIISSNGLVCLFSNVNNNWGCSTHVQYLNIYPGRCETHWWGANTDSNWPRRASYGWSDFGAARLAAAAEDAILPHKLLCERAHRVAAAGLTHWDPFSIHGPAPNSSREIMHKQWFHSLITRLHRNNCPSGTQLEITFANSKWMSQKFKQE